MGDFEVLAIEGGGFIAGEEENGIDHVGHGGEGMLRRLVPEGAGERHAPEELAGGGALGLLAQMIHGGEHGADTLALDRTWKDAVHADAVGAKFGGQAPRQGVHRRLGDDVAGAAEIFRARENGGDIDDGGAGLEVGRGGARHVPRHREDVAGGIAHGLAFGPQLPAGDRHVAEPLFGA